MILTLAGLTLLTVPGLTIESYGHPYVDLQVQPLLAYHGKLEVKPLQVPNYQLPQPYSIDGNGNIYLTSANVDFLVKSVHSK